MWTVSWNGRDYWNLMRENSYLVGELVDADPLDQLQGASITYRIAVG